MFLAYFRITWGSIKINDENFINVLTYFLNTFLQPEFAVQSVTLDPLNNQIDDSSQRRQKEAEEIGEILGKYENLLTTVPDMGGQVRVSEEELGNNFKCS
jgi:hypothetical protein